MGTRQGKLHTKGGSYCKYEHSSINLTADSQPIDFFKLFLTEEVVSFMVDESNRFAEQYLQKSAFKPKSSMSINGIPQ
jgi:hypothetical protein